MIRGKPMTKMYSNHVKIRTLEFMIAGLLCVGYCRRQTSPISLNRGQAPLCSPRKTSNLCGLSPSSGRFVENDGGVLFIAIEQCPVEHLHRFQVEVIEHGPHPLPKIPFAAKLFPNGAKQGATELLGLIDKEGEHHEHHEVGGKILFAQPEVVLEVISLILQGVEGLVLDLPTRPTAPHDLVSVLFGDGEIGDPAERFHLVSRHFPVFQDIYQKIRIGLIERNSINESKVVAHALSEGIIHGKFSGLAGFGGPIHTLEKKGMISRLDTENEMHGVSLQVPYMRRIGTESIFCNDHLQVGVVFSKLLDKPPGCVALAVVFRLPVLLEDHLGHEGDHLFEIRMNEGSAKHLQVIGDFSRLADFHHAGFRRELRGRKVARAIQTQKIAPVHEYHRLQGLAPLKIPKDFKENAAKRLGYNLIDDLPHPTVTRNPLDPVDRVQVVIPCCFSALKGKKTGIFETEHGKTGHESVGHGDVRLAMSPIGNVLERASDRFEKSIRTQMLSDFYFRWGILSLSCLQWMLLSDQPFQWGFLKELPYSSWSRSATVLRVFGFPNKPFWPDPSPELYESSNQNPALTKGFQGRRELLLI